MLYLLGQARNAGVSCLDHRDALRLWIEAWDEWQGGGSRGAAVRFRAEADAWARYPDEPWDPSLI